jgi:amino acid adenylation domain-containing protein
MSDVLDRVGRLSPAKQKLLQQKLLERSTSKVPPIAPSPLRGTSDRFPCSFSQQRLWFLHEMDPESPAYNVPSALRLLGPLDRGALARALTEVVRRHEVLRSTFAAGEEGPLQVVSTPAPVALPEIDLGGLRGEALTAELDRRLGEEARRPFDLALGPVLRAALLRLGEEDHVLLVSLHHIVSDDWSRSLLIRELAELYRAFRGGRRSPLPDLPVQYADFADWQRRWLQGEVLAAQIEHWRRRLAGAPPLLSLPADRPRPAVLSPRGESRPFFFPADLSRRLEELSRGEGTTLFATLLTAFQTLLCRCSDQEDVCVGTPVAGRRHRETEDLIGFFVNTLVMRSDLAGDPVFRDALRGAGEAWLDDQANQDLPFEKLIDELRIERTLAHTPLFQVMLALQNTPRAAAPLEDLALVPVETSTRSSKFDLTLVLSAGEAGLEGTLEYSTDLFDVATADRLLGHFGCLLAGVAADPDRRIWSLPLLTPEERHALIAGRNSGAARAAVETTLDRLFAAQVARAPEAVAVVCEGERLTYAELAAVASRWAARLRGAGVGPEARVGLCVERSLAMVVGIVAILEAGGAYVPLDPGYPEERLRFLLADSGIRVLLTQRSLRERLPACDALVIDLDKEPEDETVVSVPATADPQSLAYIIYTSGSTGRPKGVGVSHANVVRLFRSTESLFDFGPGDVWTLFHSHAFDFSVWEIWGALLYGGTLVVVPYWVSRSPATFRELLARERVTVLNQTPSAFRQLVDADAVAERQGLALRYVIFGGEALDLQSLAPWFERHGDRRPRLVNMYGITETTVHVTWRPVDAADVERNAGSVIGTALPDLSLAVLDRNGEPAPVGVAGEMYVGGAGVARGYLGRPDLTAQRFVPDPFGREPGGRLYRSGDLARYLPNLPNLPDGDLEYLGRIDHQVKIRGFRIELGEIETALGEHPAVKQAVVLARDEGGGDRRLVAYLVPGSEALPGIEELRAFLRRRLPEPMLPAAFVPLAELPLTAHGKIDRAALPAPERERSRLAGEIVPPRTPEERALAEVWSRVLGLAEVGVGDNFFALGGDSILSIRVRSLAAEKGLCFELQDLFRHQTLGDLARAARTAGEEAEIGEPFALVSPADRKLLPGGLDDAYPLSRLQLGMLFHGESGEGSIPYHNVSRFTLRGVLEPAALERALALLAGRHPVLRTSFEEARFGEPLQLVHREARIPLDFADLRALSPARRERVRDERFETERSLRFDRGRAPLLRLWAHRLTDDTCDLGVTEHHAIVDGWSFATLLSELFALYFTEIDGRPADLAPLPRIAFRDFVALERRTIASEESRRFWSDRLAGHVFRELPRWPGRFPAPAAPAAPARRIQSVPVPLDAATTAALGRLAETLAVPFKSVLLAAHLRVLELLAGDPDVTTGLVVNGRPEVEGGERVLGLFLNTAPFRLRLAEGTWSDLVRAVFAAERDLLPHRRFPLAELQRTHGQGRRLFEVSFNYVHFHVLQSTRDLEVLDVRTFAETSFGLTLHCDRSALGAELEVLLHYDATELFPAQVLAFAELYGRTLPALARSPEASWVSPLPLPEAQLHQIVAEWSQTGPRPDPGITAHRLFRDAAERSPGAVALAWRDERVTYAELALRSRRLAQALRGLGAGPGARIGLCLERSPEMVEALLAVLEAGAAYVPLDPASPPERLAWLAADSGISLLLTLERHLPALAEASAALPGIVPLEAIAPEAPPAPAAGGEAGADDLAYILYTSGSTGRPKGVMVPHRGLVHYLLWAVEAYRVAEGPGAPVHSALGFDLTVTSLLAPLVAGRTVTLLPAEGDVEALADELRRSAGLSLVKITPAHLEALGHLLAAGEHAERTRALVIGGERLAFESLEAWRRHAPGTRLINEYGPTETVVGCCVYEVAPDDPRSGPVPIGRAIAGARLYVVGAGGRPVPAGAPGELWIGGAGVAWGYRNRPDLTAERFVPDPFGAEPGARLYRSGDRVRHLPDGRLEFLGRVDDQVKIRGFRIEPGEIEAALRSEPRVLEAVVVAREGAARERRLVAYLVAAAEPPTADELRAWLRQRLPEPMVPAAFVFLPELPLTPNGKIDRGALPDPAQGEGRREGAAPPRDEIELRLVRLWEDLLETRPIGIRDDFFALGGHSLLALRLMGSLELLYGRRIPLSALLEASTVEKLARLLRQEGEAPQRPLLVPLQPRGSRTPLFCVHPAGGNVFCYLPLARESGLEGPVHALQAPLPGRRPAPWTVETMAALYLGALLEVRPAGPYRLAGWSLGGVVAFEMARRLDAAGEEVELLAMIDVAAPAPAGPETEDEDERASFALDLAGLAGFGLGPATLEELSAREDLRELFDLFAANRRAARAYRPGPYRGRVLLVRAAETAATSPAGLEAWQGLAAGGAEVRVLPGDHYSLLRLPLVAALAELLEARP